MPIFLLYTLRFVEIGARFPWTIGRLQHFITGFVRDGTIDSRVLRRSRLLLDGCGGPQNARKHREYYIDKVVDDSLPPGLLRRLLDIEVTQHPETVYARAVTHRSENSKVLALQYWYCYFYNDWDNRHEGDWESVTVFVEALPGVENAYLPRRSFALEDYKPVACAATNHLGGIRAPWSDLEWLDSRPLVFVARGSHANYFRPGTFSPPMQVGGLTVRRMDVRLLGGLARLFGDPRRRDETPPSETEYHVGNCKIVRLDDDGAPWWLDYAGLWGAAGSLLSPGTDAPKGPKFQPSSVWKDPFTWYDEECVSTPTSHLEQARLGAHRV